MAKSDAGEMDQELEALGTVFSALKQLDTESQARVLDYVSLKLGLGGRKTVAPPEHSTGAGTDEARSPTAAPTAGVDADEVDGLEGISPVARKWMARNKLSAEQLSKLYSLGVDEIDLVTNSVPGKNKKDRMRSVFLLKGVAAYLSTGAARVSHEQVKEACLHYDAYDSSNFASYLRRMASEIGGTKEAGYTLTARGLTSATEIVKELTAPPQK